MGIEKERPLEVSIIGWLFILSGFAAFLTLFIITFFVNSENSQYLFNCVHYSAYDPIFWVGVIFLGRGLLKLQKWALLVTTWIAKIFCVVVVILFVVHLLGIKTLNIIIDGKDTFSLVINLIILYYLTRPDIKEQFK
ncbi:MAG: hypothetical protein PHI59_00620 [Candidatus Omnitrophica bacterium]|nr:hypothetical protein [Candidatus Omnitrophota bacterium]